MISPLLLISLKALFVFPHTHTQTHSCCFSYCVTGNEAESWWHGVKILGVVSDRRDTRSAKPALRVPSGNCPNANHQVSTFQGSYALEADGNQTRGEDEFSLSLSAHGPRSGDEWLVELVMCCDTS